MHYGIKKPTCDVETKRSLRRRFSIIQRVLQCRFDPEKPLLTLNTQTKPFSLRILKITKNLYRKISREGNTDFKPYNEKISKPVLLFIIIERIHKQQQNIVL